MRVKPDDGPTGRPSKTGFWGCNRAWVWCQWSDKAKGYNGQKVVFQFVLWFYLQGELQLPWPSSGTRLPPVRLLHSTKSNCLACNLYNFRLKILILVLLQLSHQAVIYTRAENWPRWVSAMQFHELLIEFRISILSKIDLLKMFQHSWVNVLCQLGFAFKTCFNANIWL